MKVNTCEKASCDSGSSEGMERKKGEVINMRINGASYKIVKVDPPEEKEEEESISNCNWVTITAKKRIGCDKLGRKVIVEISEYLLADINKAMGLRTVLNISRKNKKE